MPPARRPHAPVRRRPRRLLLTCLWGHVLPAILLACTPPAPVDPLDPAEVEEAAKGEGDAVGSDRSGTYEISAAGEPTCDCPEIEGVDLCALDLTMLSGSGATLTLAQTDGFLTLSPTGAEALLSLSGSLDGDGAFDLGGIYDLGSVLGEGELYTRMDGRFTAADRFTATLRDRVRGTIGDETVDCRHEFELEGARIPSP